MRNILIKQMWCLAHAHKLLPPPHDWRGFFTAAQMVKIIGRRPTWTDGSALHLLGWTRSVRKVHGTTQRVWFPPVKD